MFQNLKDTLYGGAGVLKKLTVESADKSLLLGPAKFEAQFNPTSYKHAYRNSFQRFQSFGSRGAKLKFLVSTPEVIHFNLILQKTLGSMTSFAMLGLGGIEESVYDRVQKFLKLAYQVEGTTHAPRQLIVSWGKMHFAGVLESADVNYTAFDNSGLPIRAELAVSFKGSMKDPYGATTNSSPDLTHAKTVKDWQTLPMLTEEIYADPHLYLQVAQANGLDHFRALKPGQKLHFPPTQKDDSAV